MGSDQAKYTTTGTDATDHHDGKNMHKPDTRRQPHQRDDTTHKAQRTGYTMATTYTTTTATT